MRQHIQSNEIHLFEISLCDWHHHQRHSTCSSSRIEALYSTLLATQAFFTTFLSLPTSAYPSFPFSTWAQNLHAIQVIAKLSLLTDIPGWDLTYVRGVLDFSALLDQLTLRFEEAREAEEQAQRDRGT